jgi:hypothetical protein
VGWRVLVFLLLSQFAYADVPPISVSFFGMYGTPVQPLGLAGATANGYGLDVLGEWNPSDIASLGLSFEKIYFEDVSNFSVPMLNLEGRLFPFENGKNKFSPYLFGGAGLNLSSTGGPVQLKAGVGSRVSLIGPLFFDIAAGSHWIQPPNDFQYVDVRAGLSCFIDFKPASEKPSTPKATTTPGSPTPLVQASTTATITTTPTVTETPTAAQSPEEINLEESPTATPIALIEAAPVTTLAGVKKYYKLGMKAFLDRNYALSFKLLKKSLAVKEIHGAKYYYAETYATLGVIYQFHSSKVKDHEQKALIYYKKALAIDPTTKSAKHYYKKLKAKLAAEAKKKPKHRPASSPTTPVVPTSTASISVDTSGLSNSNQ